MHVKKGNKVIIMVGKDKGVTGEIVRAFPKLGKIVVAGANKSKRHLRASASNKKGQIIEKEMPINASNVKLVK